MTKEQKNQYEELIDKMMIDEVSGLDNDVRSTLEGLSTSKKRMAILSILDKDRDMFIKIRDMVKDNSISKAEHIKNVVEMLRKYVEVGNTEQRKFGEVFTSYDFVNKLCDLVKPEDWKNPELKFLDNSAGAGNIPAVIIERLMNGLKQWEPNDELRYQHIVENMLFMCELQSKNAFLILAALDPNDEYALNIYNGSFLTKEFDIHSEEVWGVDKYDYVIMNSPYQKLDGGHAASALPLYNKFIEKSIEISDKVISIHPSRWMAGGRGLSEFREMMYSRTDIKTIIHFNDSKEVFGNHVDIRGGIQYFLIDKSYNGLINYNGINCELNKFDIFVEPKYHSIISKVTGNNLGQIGINASASGIRTNDKRMKDSILNKDYIKCFVSKQKGFIKYVDKNEIRNKIHLNSHKVITAEAAGKGADGFGNKFVGYKNETFTDSYIGFFVDSEKDANSLISYMNTKFCNFLLSLRKNTQHIKPDTCKWIPLVPFNREWTDEMLFEYFKLTKEEQELILNKK